MSTNQPFKKGDWVAMKGDGSQPLFGTVYDVYEDLTSPDGKWLIDVVVFNHLGERVGRESPAMGGPTRYEPACPASNCEKIMKPSFPLKRSRFTGAYSHLLRRA